MTAPRNTHLIIKPLWHGGRFYHPGTTFPPEGLDISREDVQRYASGGEQAFIVTSGEAERRQNPDAFDAREQGRAQQQELTRLREENEQLRQTVAGMDLTPLHALLGPVGSVDETVQAAAALQEKQTDTQAQLEDQTARLGRAHEQIRAFLILRPTPPGTDLPSNFLRRAALAPFGLTTFESLRGLTAAQLAHLPDVTAEQAARVAATVAAHFQD